MARHTLKPANHSLERSRPRRRENVKGSWPVRSSRGRYAEPAIRVRRILGAVLGACAAMIGGALARLSVASTLEAEALDLAPIEMLAGALFGLLRWASGGRST